jgi:hypothetical protein
LNHVPELERDAFLAICSNCFRPYWFLRWPGVMATGALICCDVLQAMQVRAIGQRLGSLICGSIQRVRSPCDLFERSRGGLELYVVARIASRKSKDIVGGIGTWRTPFTLPALHVDGFALVNGFDKPLPIEVWWWKSDGLPLGLCLT